MTLPKKLLVATDFSPCGDRASQTALEWAAALGGEIHWVHVTEALPETTPPSAEPLLASYVEQARRLGGQKLEQWARRARERGIETDTRCLDAPVAPAIADYAGEIGADCVLVGSKGYTGLRHMLLGSVAERIARQAPCSVLVVRGEGSPAEPGTIALGDDLVLEAEPARAVALELARTLAAKLVVVHALDLGIPYLASLDLALPNGAFEKIYAEAKERMRRSTPEASDVEIEHSILSARPATAVCEEAEKGQAGLVVVGSHSRKGLDRIFLGSVAESVLKHAHCSVLVVRTPAKA
jgi:nucleotide-binding universal stress UspA family protein